MENDQYLALRKQSDDLFKNGLVVPIARAILDLPNGESAFGVTEIREALGGRAASNQIREVLGTRLEPSSAVEELPYLGKPHPKLWRKLKCPFWGFIESWADIPKA
jgi:hypothetical protein